MSLRRRPIYRRGDALRGNFLDKQRRVFDASADRRLIIVFLTLGCLGGLMIHKKQLPLPHLKGKLSKAKKTAKNKSADKAQPDEQPSDAPQETDIAQETDSAQQLNTAQEPEPTEEKGQPDTGTSEPDPETNPETPERDADAEAAEKTPETKPKKEKIKKEKRPRRPLFKKKSKEFVFEGEEEQPDGAADETNRCPGAGRHTKK